MSPQLTEDIDICFLLIQIAIAAAAERRAAEQKAKSQTKHLRKANAELPDNPGSGGLRWQVG